MEVTIRAVRHQHTGTRFMNILTHLSTAARDEKLLALAAELTATRKRLDEAIAKLKEASIR